MITYAATLGTFCLTFFGLNALTNADDAIGIALFACIMSIATLFVVNAVMTDLQSKTN